MMHDARLLCDLITPIINYERKIICLIISLIEYYAPRSR